jgi:Holliday junction resolvase
MRRAAKVDANQDQVVSALRSAGVKVLSLAAIGKGVPDLLCCFRGRLVLLEVKDGAKVPSARKLTADQIDWHREWADVPLHVVESAEQALKAMGCIV